MTTTYLHPVLAACLIKAEQKIGGEAWEATNEQQADLVTALPSLRRLISSLPPGMLEGIGSTSAADINAFLRERGMSITVPDFGPDDFGVAAVLDAFSTWRQPGSKVKIRSEGTWYPAVMAKDGFEVYEVGEAQVFKLAADLEVYMVKSKDLAAGLDILSRLPSAVRADDIDCVTFPMIDHDGEADVSWLLGLSNTGHRITAAIAQAKIRMNEYGIRAKAGAAARVTRSAPMHPLLIDSPFTLAICVRGVPALAFHLTTECWREPPNLDEATSGTTKAERW